MSPFHKEVRGLICFVISFMIPAFAIAVTVLLLAIRHDKQNNAADTDWVTNTAWELSFDRKAYDDAFWQGYRACEFAAMIVEPEYVIDDFDGDGIMETNRVINGNKMQEWAVEHHNFCLIWEKGNPYFHTITNPYGKTENRWGIYK